MAKNKDKRKGSKNPSKPKDSPEYKSLGPKKQKSK